jgi:hypothetical protein
MIGTMVRALADCRLPLSMAGRQLPMMMMISTGGPWG